MLTTVSESLCGLNDSIKNVLRFALVLLAGRLSDFVFRYLPLREAASLIYLFIFFFYFVTIFFKRSKIIHSCDNKLLVVRPEIASCVTLLESLLYKLEAI